MNGANVCWNKVVGKDGRPFPTIVNNIMVTTMQGECSRSATIILGKGRAISPTMIIGREVDSLSYGCERISCGAVEHWQSLWIWSASMKTAEISSSH